MAKLSKSAVKEKLAEYAAVQKKISATESTENAEIDPFLVKFERDTKAIRAKYEKKRTPLFEKAAAIEAEVEEFLSSQEKDIEIEEAGYVAERKTQTKLLARVIDVKKFLEVAKKKGEAMYACISVGVKKAEDLLGKEIDLISERPEKREVVVALRQK